MPTQFVIVSLPRTGTHMLRTLLNQHPNIRAETELFNEHSKLCRKWRRRSAEWILRNIAWREGQEHIRGCAIHLCHGHTWGIWQHLLSLPDVRYLCLRRFNLLEQYLSLQQALVHQRWQIYRNDPCPSVRPMSFKPDDMERYFRNMEGHWHRFDQTFADRPRYDICYEELCRDTEAVSRRIQEFLGAQVMAGLQPDTIKVGRPASELIGNYDELRQYFAGSPYQSFFTDDDSHRRRIAA